MSATDIQTAAAELFGIDKFLNELRRGGEYEPLFARRDVEQADYQLTIWANAWLVNEERRNALEGEAEFDVYPWIQEGFHPSLWLAGGGGGEFGYESIYAGSAAPLVLGWSADSRYIDATLSQEFERFYKLSKFGSAELNHWDSWYEAIDNVVLRDIRDGNGYVIARRDYVRDYQDIRRHWFMLAYYAEWMRRPLDVHNDKDDTRKEKRQNGVRRDNYFGRLNSNGDDFAIVENKGYLLVPPPPEPQFSRRIGVLPESARSVAEKVEFQTSHGRVRPSEVREQGYVDSKSFALVMFDQEVLRKYQDEPNAKFEIDHLGVLRITTRHVHVVGASMFLLGTEYVSSMLKDFVVGVPATEWPHWQAYNIPFIGDSTHQRMASERSLFALRKQLNRLPLEVNEGVRAITGRANIVTFAELHPGENAGREIERALPRRSSVSELIRRAQALNSFVLERLSEHRLRNALVSLGVERGRLERVGSLKLFTSLIALCAVASHALTWASPEEAISYAASKLQTWQDSQSSDADEDYRIIQTCLDELDPIFGIANLRLLSAHSVSSETEARAKALLESHCGIVVPGNDYRQAIIDLYNRLIACLTFASG